MAGGGQSNEKKQRKDIKGTLTIRCPSTLSRDEVSKVET